MVNIGDTLLVAQYDATARYPLDLFTGERQARLAPIKLVSPDWRAED